MSLTATKKLIQVSEEVQKPVHVPVVLGNECIIVTQQDVRKIEDIRFISYHKIGPNGDLIPADTQCGQEAALRDAVALAGMQLNSDQVTKQQLLELLGKCCTQKEEPVPIKASIAQQMEWANSENSSPPFPFTQTTSTSMSGMPTVGCSKCCCDKSYCCSCLPKFVVHQGCNTVEDAGNQHKFEGSLSARQVLKLRKSIEDTVGI